ncbi:arylesterase [Rubellicoccus peritrichatus]|uniref:Arylesterase n=1 Tax=Rubellicoccus peritrichatus TaxID=3080537 RepID=A0AAQ3QU16_9BACT|nr:arylesterase [Puniceicoccus sp. CR14]WOO41941.1 arylesterase [Puniceicoccus sp. CR14]
MKTISRVFLILLTFSSLSAAEENGTILFFGDSLTAGYGIDPDRAYPALIENQIDAEGLPWEVVVGAVSGDTSAGGLRRVDWMLRRPVDVFVLALGANDGLRGFNTDKTQENLQGIIDRVRAKNPDVRIVIAGMLMPPSLGAEYTKAFAKIYPDLAEANDAVLIPFLLEGVAGKKSLNLPDRIHPTPEGHAIIEETVWEYLQPVLTEPKSE